MRRGSTRCGWAKLLTHGVNHSSWWVCEVWMCAFSSPRCSFLCSPVFLWSELCIRKHEIRLSLKSFTNVSAIQIHLHFQNKRCSRTDYKGESVSKSCVWTEFLSVSIILNQRMVLASCEPASAPYSNILTIISCQRIGAKCYINLEWIMSYDWPRVHIQEAKHSLAFQYALTSPKAHRRASVLRPSGRDVALLSRDFHPSTDAVWISRALSFRAISWSTCHLICKCLVEFPHDKQPPPP